jgi:dihydroxyacetone kinase
MKRKCLINGLSDTVSESLEGALMGNPSLARLGDQNIVVRADIAEERQKHVTIIGGGGSGHEPSYVGFIGEGMISAAVCGNVFASPSVSAILTTIRTCAGPHGVLLIVKNYTGDRLNFGVALEKARQENIKVQMVVVADDVALETDKGITGGRGLAGTLFIHKLAGALAKRGSSLEEIYDYITPVSKNLYTMGVALTSCTLPGSVINPRLSTPEASNTIEVGLGIHGEGGREQVQLPDTPTHADFVSTILVDNVMKKCEVHKESNEVVIMLNNLGAGPPIELTIVLRKVMTYLKERYSKDVVRVFAGPYMTSLDMVRYRHIRHFLTHLLTHSLTHSLTYSPTYSLTH